MKGLQTNKSSCECTRVTLFKLQVLTLVESQLHGRRPAFDALQYRDDAVPWLLVHVHLRSEQHHEMRHNA
eukprot:m.352035 g.352035  ORF g.352035 m.352035 type:complete len:70 (-) comp16423_c0_seq1:3760-3969(-)